MDLFTEVMAASRRQRAGGCVVINDWLGRGSARQNAALEAEEAEASLMLKVQQPARQMVTVSAEEVARLSERLACVEAELRDLQREHTRMISDKDAKITALEGEKRVPLR